MEYNINFKPWDQAILSTEGGKGFIEEPADQSCNIPFQYRQSAPSQYEADLCQSLEKLFLQNVQGLPEIVEGLNSLGTLRENGKLWTTNSFESEIKRLANQI